MCAVIRQHHERSVETDNDRELQSAAVREILNDPPLEFLRCLAEDLRAQKCAIMFEKWMRRKVLRKVKAEAAAARMDPLTLLKATVGHLSRASTSMACHGMQRILNKLSFGHCLPSDAQMSSTKKGLERLADADLEIHATPDGYRITLKRVVEMEASHITQTIAVQDLQTATMRSVVVQPGGGTTGRTCLISRSRSVLAG